MNLLIFGASITWGAWDTEGGGWAQRLKNYYDKKVIASESQNGVYTYPLGIPGDTSRDLLERFEVELKARVGKEEKTQIIISIGINDSHFHNQENKHRTSPEEYISNLEQLIKISQSYQADMMFVSLTPVDDRRVDPTPWTPEWSYKLEYIQKYNQLMNDVAQKHQIICIDVLTPLLQKPNWEKILVDGIHPNPQGHQFIFDTLLPHLNLGSK